MLGPSPDWLGGVSKLNLCLPNCTWAENYMENVFIFDAGTDSGLSYNVIRNHFFHSILSNDQ